MAKVYLIVGTCHTGKSSLVNNTFIKGRTPKLKRDLMRYSELDDCVLLGWYGEEFKRRGGTDNIERKQIGLLAKQIVRLLPLGKIIVLEGIRCCSRPMMKQLKENGITPTLICLSISDQCSMNRWIQFDIEHPGNQTKAKEKVKISGFRTFVKMCMNFYNDFKNETESCLIDTTNVTDFSQFSLDNLCGAEVVEEHHKEN